MLIRVVLWVKTGHCTLVKILQKLSSNTVRSSMFCDCKNTFFVRELIVASLTTYAH